MATFVNTKAFCQVCKVSTNKRCIVCKTTYYCSGVCKKKDAKNHKKECTEHIKVLNRDERDERLITGAMEKLKLPTSFQEITPFRSIKQMCEIACEVFHRDVISEKEGLSYKVLFKFRQLIKIGINSIRNQVCRIEAPPHGRNQGFQALLFARGGRYESEREYEGFRGQKLYRTRFLDHVLYK